MAVLKRDLDTYSYLLFARNWQYGTVTAPIKGHPYRLVCRAPLMSSYTADVPLNRKLDYKNGVKGNMVVPTPYQRLVWEAKPGKAKVTTTQRVDAAYTGFPVDTWCKPSGCTLSIVDTRFSVPQWYGPGVIYRPTGNTSVSLPSDLIAKGRDRMYSDAKSNKIQLGETLAEFAKSVGTVSSLATSLAQSYMHMRRGNFREAINELSMVVKPFKRGLSRKEYKFTRANEVARNKRLTRSDVRYLEKFKTARERKLARQWLAWHYGCIPILMDIDSLYNLSISGLSKVPSLSFNSRGRANLKTTRDLVHGIATYKCDITQRYEVGSTWRVTDITQFNAGQIGFGKQDIPRLLWALTPGSFMVDWLMNVDGVLTSLSVMTASGLSYVHGYETRSVTVKGSAEVDHQKLTVQEKERTTYSSSFSSFAMVRAKRTTAPAPLLYVKNPLSLNHLATVAAILSGADTKRLQQR